MPRGRDPYQLSMTSLTLGVPKLFLTTSNLIFELVTALRLLCVCSLMLSRPVLLIVQEILMKIRRMVVHWLWLSADHAFSQLRRLSSLRYHLLLS